MITALGTSAIGLATQAWHVLIFRATAWFGRGVRTPVRKALLAASMTPETYGRAFGFERMMDTVGAIIGPATATALLVTFHHHYSGVFLVTLIPGLAAAGVIAFLVREKERAPVPHISFGARLAALPPRFRRFLLAVDIFGSGDFAHTMLILLAAQKLTAHFGAPRAATFAVSLYLLHNVLYALFAFVAGWLADHFEKRILLAGGYALAAVMGLVLVLAPINLPSWRWYSFWRESTSPQRKPWKILSRLNWWTGAPRHGLRRAGDGQRHWRFLEQYGSGDSGVSIPGDHAAFLIPCQEVIENE